VLAIALAAQLGAWVHTAIHSEAFGSRAECTTCAWAKHNPAAVSAGSYEPLPLVALAEPAPPSHRPGQSIDRAEPSGRAPPSACA